MNRSVVFIIALLLLGVPHVYGQEQFVYEETPVRAVITDIQSSSSYRFLYRDALISGKTVSFDAVQEALVAALDDALRAYNLQLLVDDERHQIVVASITPAENPPTLILKGSVIDDESGARLPFATITWKRAGTLQGVAANEAGVFQLDLGTLGSEEILVLSASYVGYDTKTVHLSRSNMPDALPIRLSPEPLIGREVVVNSTVLHADLDTSWHHLLQPSLFAPVGEGSVIRVLQPLPSVSLSPALSQGLNVRGSKADGFQVLLDGTPIYNQSHFFGLFDAFNADALQTVGFYYDVTPAQFQGPPGGTLSFVTRTGSMTEAQQSFGLSNTAYKATLEGPIREGRGSWLLSGRHSYLNSIEWFNNRELIAQGLDVGRGDLPSLPRGNNGTSEQIEQLRNAIALGDASAQFYDLHAKLYLESEGGDRLMLNGYLGGDNTLHEAIRLEPTEPGSLPERLPVKTQNRWGNEAASLHYQRTLSTRAFSHTMLAFSHYRSRYSKDDFLYGASFLGMGIEPPRGDKSPPRDSLRQGPRDRSFFDTFTNRNDLYEIKAGEHLDVALPQGGILGVGIDLHHYTITYEESSAHTFDDAERSSQIDAYVQYDMQAGTALDVTLGLRTHYFANGGFLRTSPRLHARLFAQKALSAGLGYSRNYQFLHRVYLENENSSDVWVMSNADEAPGSVDNLTAGLYLKPNATLFFQVEAYLKKYQNMRLHATIAARRNPDGVSLLLDPWLHDTEGRARGLEMMARYRLGPLLWTHSYTWSRMELRHDILLRGQYFAADWDRRHQYTTHIQATLRPSLKLHLTWLYATGSPNTLSFSDANEAERLADYHRLDASMEYQFRFRTLNIKAQASVFNVYDRDNVWYRTPVPVIDGPSQQAGTPFRLEHVDVFDLGLQPSFELSVVF